MNRVRCPYVSQRVAQTRFCYFSSRFQLLSKKVCYKVSLCETFSGKVLAMHHSSIQRPIDGLRTTSPSNKNLRSKWPTPSENADFDRYRLIVPQPWELAKKILISTNRKSTKRFPVSHRWTVHVTPKSPKGWLKTRIFTFGVALHFFVAGNRRHFKLNMWLEDGKSQPTWYARTTVTRLSSTAWVYF